MATEFTHLIRSAELALAIPLSPKLTDADIERVISAVSSLISSRR